MNVFDRWPFSTSVCTAWIFFDYSLTFASSFTIILISVDRYWAMQWPTNYKIRNTRQKSLSGVGVVWLTAFLLWTYPCLSDRLKPGKLQHGKYCFWDPANHVPIAIAMAVIMHHLPMICLVLCYLRVSRLCG